MVKPTTPSTAVGLQPSRRTAELAELLQLQNVQTVADKSPLKVLNPTTAAFVNFQAYFIARFTIVATQKSWRRF